MEYNDKMFEKIAVCRVKKFYDMNKDIFLSRAMDFTDLLQVMRIKIWEGIQRYKDLTEEELEKMINKILSRQLISEKRHGYRYMKSEDVVVNECTDEEKVVRGHVPQSISLDLIDESQLIDNRDMTERQRILVDVINSTLNLEERELLRNIYMNGITEFELACKQLECIQRDKCCLHTHQEDHIGHEGNIEQPEFKEHCQQFSKLNTQREKINRLKKVVLERLKKK